MNITETEKGFEIVFEYDYSKIQAVKNIPGAWFKGATKTWHVGKHRRGDVFQFAKRFGLSSIGSGSASSENQMPEQVGETPEMPILDVPLTLLKTPFPYQAQGIAYNRIHKRAIIGDQPGLGKTLQLIGTICSYGYEDNHLALGPGLIICPSTLKLNWQREWMETAGIRSMILTDKVMRSWTNYHKLGMVDVFIVNYESLKKFFVLPGWKKPNDGTFRLNTIPFLESINLFKWVAIDESHKCKDRSTQQSKFVMGITKGKEYVFELTGTPVINKPKDLIAQLVIINRLQEIVSHIPRPTDKSGKLTDLSGYKRFIDRYCDGGNGATNLKELNYRITSSCFYRREKHEVLKDLPDKTRQVILCEITNRSEYDQAENQFVNYLKQVRGCTEAEVKKKLRGELMVKIGILKQISARGKIKAVKDYIDDILDSGEKFGLFFHLREIVHNLKEIYPDALTIYGENSLEERDRAVRSFQTNAKDNLILLNDQAGGVGLTLTAASRMGFIEFPWTYASCEQCEDRFHRIGQIDNVQCAYFLGENTIDQYCYDIIQKKKDMSKTITGSTEEIQEEIVNELLNLFNQK